MFVVVVVLCCSYFGIGRVIESQKEKWRLDAVLFHDVVKLFESFKEVNLHDKVCKILIKPLLNRGRTISNGNLISFVYSLPVAMLPTTACSRGIMREHTFY